MLCMCLSLICLSVDKLMVKFDISSFPDHIRHIMFTMVIFNAFKCIQCALQPIPGIGHYVIALEWMVDDFIPFVIMMLMTITPAGIAFTYILSDTTEGLQCAKGFTTFMESMYYFSSNNKSSRLQRL